MSEALLAEFSDAQVMLDALSKLRDARFRDVETFTPFDVPGLGEALGERRSPVGWIALLGGITGIVSGYGIQWWSNVHAYPLNVGGRPVHAVPAFAVATVETAMLFAAGAAFFGMLVMAGFPRLWAREDEVDGFDRASVDRFWVKVRSIASNDECKKASQVLTAAGALRILTFPVAGAVDDGGSSARDDAL